MAGLTRADFDACLAFLAGDLAAPAGAFEAEPGAAPRWTSPRIWRRAGWFGIRNGRVARWFRGNVGTIASEESVRVLEDGVAVGTLEASYAERLSPATGSCSTAARWRSDGWRARSSTPGPAAASRACRDGPATASRCRPSWPSSWPPSAPRRPGGWPRREPRRSATGWPASSTSPTGAAAVIVELLEAQEQWSEVPDADGLLVEESPAPEGPGLVYTFHAPLHRAACEALARAVGARLGRRFGRNLTLAVADLGWSIRLARGRRDRSPVTSGRSWIPIGSRTTCSRGSTGASCWLGGSATSRRRP